MVSVFRTDIVNSFFADFLVTSLISVYPDYKINFDLEDCDNILRIEGKWIDSESIKEYMVEYNCLCVELV